MILLIPKDDEIKFVNMRIKKTYSQILLEGFISLNKQSNKIIIDNLFLTNNFHNISLNENNFISFLKNKKIYVTKYNELLNNFLTQENIRFKPEIICDYCEAVHEINVLKTYYTYNNKKLCVKCAKKVISNYIKENAYHDFFNARMDFLLKKYDKIEDILDAMTEKYNPLNRNLTLYDTLEVNEENYDKILIKDLNIPEDFKNILSRKYSSLLPVQSIALNKGLLEDTNLLVVSQTASGKTLIGELAGIPKVLKNKKMIYLSPLVALANQKYMDFKRDYESLGLSVAIKVGRNKINVDDELYIENESIKDADIIVATYEGLDYILRSGNSHILDNLGVVVIDEIHMLENEERGHRLNGLINRLILLFPEVQLIGLSATIKNANEIAKEFSMNLIEYNKRPVKLERHYTSFFNEEDKYKFIAELCKNEFDEISSKGFHGQSIIFTDSRRKTQIITSKLKNKGIKAEYYHAGLTYSKKIEIQEKFLNQDISTIVTTSALANGVDFPASLVIFESIRMGIDYLSNNEFHQMLGRAGRPTYHDLGKTYITVITPKKNKFYFNLDYQIALELLNHDVDNVNVLYNEWDVYEQVLSDICAVENLDIEKLRKRYDSYLIPVTFDEALFLLKKEKMIKFDKNTGTYTATNFGRAVSVSFISVYEAEVIKTHINSDLLNLVLMLESIHNVYLSNNLINKLSSILNINMGANVFSDKNRDIIYNCKHINHLNQKLKNKLVNIEKDFMKFKDDSIYHDYFAENISKRIINRRLQGWNPHQISNEFKREYELIIYPGDIYSYLDQTIIKLEAIKRISKSMQIKHISKKCDNLIKKIENGG